MNIVTKTTIGASLLGLAVCLPVLAQPDAGFVRMAPEEAPFKSPLGVGPERAVIFGDPSKPGIYVVRNRFPPGSHSNPHFHSQDRHATVIKGVWWTGVGGALDFNKAVPLKAGSYMLHPANATHWDGAGDEEVIVQIIGMGPVDTTEVAGASVLRGYWPKPK